LLLKFKSLRKKAGYQGSRAKLLSPFADDIKKITTLSDQLKSLSDSEIRNQYQELKLRPSFNMSEVEIDQDDVVSAFALTREAAWRAVNMSHYDVQLAAGLAMVQSGIAELATGEGKTLVATLPSAYFALFSKGVHVMTVNAYLAERDCELMKPVFEFLGLSVNYVSHEMPDEQKKQAYASDITYGVGSDFGFDYLRDQMKLHSAPKKVLGQRLNDTLQGRDEQVDVIQPMRSFAIVDEADSVMLDEASSALILSSKAGVNHPYPQAYLLANKLVESLQKDEHYSVDEKTNQVALLTVDESVLYASVDKSIRQILVRPWEKYVLNALKAKYLMHLDDHYVVEDSKIQIVDQFTGRRFEDRTWSEGLHQAVESYENVDITEESNSMLKVARQHFFNLYDKVSGMTGTAIGCEDEFKTLYSLNVFQIPPFKENLRKQLKTRFFQTEQQKYQSIVELVRNVRKKGMPILIGTRTVKQSESIQALLGLSGLPCQILNAKQDSEEAELVSKAGQSKVVTIATNMAGRGTDIALDSAAKESGGLFVIVSEPHLSHRVDRQLIGRSARKGDPGCAVTLLSAEDEICVLEPSLAKSINKLKEVHSESLEKKLFRVQSYNEKQAYKARLKLFKYNDWMVELMKKIN